VRDLANDIIVKVPFALGRADTDLAQAVRAALERDAPAAAPHVQSTVYDGVVTLEGVVDDRHAGEAAERAVRRVAGVRQVVNRIAERDRRVDLPAIHVAIERALERRAEREAGRLELMVDHGVVTVEGHVNSTADKHVVLELVRHAPAVRGVRDRLRVGP
jgi:osmotically-inducible protein OsmY